MSRTAPTGTIVSTNEELPVLRLSQPECPDCGGPVSKNGGYERHPQGCQRLRVQRYICANCCSFSPTHPSVADECHYPRAVTQLATTIDVLTDSSLENRQDVLTIHYDVRPSDQQIHNWCTEQTAEIVANDLPELSGVFTYDEQYLTIDGSRAYRLTVYDELLRAPVAETIADRCTKETVRTFLTTVLADKPVHVVTTDGRSDYPEIIEEDLDAVHHRCNFHFLKNGEEKLQNTVFESVRYTNTERLRGALVWSEFKQVFAAKSYEAAVRRFEAVLDKIEQLPKELRTAVTEVMEEFDTFLGHLRHEAVPSTTNNLERYYDHTKPTQIKRRFRSGEHARAFLKQQMRLRTVKQGLISRERSLSLGCELFPAVTMEQLEPLFTESKQRYLSWRDREPD